MSSAAAPRSRSSNGAIRCPRRGDGTLIALQELANRARDLAAARNRWAERHGVDVEEQGVAGLPAPVILSSGYLHPSAAQAIGMVGLGRANIRRLAVDDVGRLDLAALEHELSQNPGTAIVIANAGEVNAGDFDPIADMAELCEHHGARLHIDGAFVLFARLTPNTRPLTEGADRADSVTCDGYKWLNVPYDCGSAFVRDLERLPQALNVGAPYLPATDDPHPNFGFLALDAACSGTGAEGMKHSRPAPSTRANRSLPQAAAPRQARPLLVQPPASLPPEVF
jgi:glutamate/tyrosine decarboxylase-like PLP-dependent enzyme